MSSMSSAFPNGMNDQSQRGLTKRQYVAAQILTALVSRVMPPTGAQALAREALELADALLNQTGDY